MTKYGKMVDLEGLDPLDFTPLKLKNSGLLEKTYRECSTPTGKKQPLVVDLWLSPSPRKQQGDHAHSHTRTGQAGEFRFLSLEPIGSVCMALGSNWDTMDYTKGT